MINDTLSLSHSQSVFPVLQLESKSLVISATLFAMGVLGNIIAIVVLWISKKEQKETTFYMLVCGMVVTDMLGTCILSPVAIVTYMTNSWPGGEPLCQFFSFCMLFSGSAGMSIICAMAVERYLAINHAYFYSQHIDQTVARFALLVIYLANILLCIMPSFSFGQHVRHFPGTWCFLDWRAMDPLGASYSFLYGGVMVVLIAVAVLCNLAVCRSLVGMNQTTVIVWKESCTQGGSRRRFPRLLSVTSAAEIQMIWLLIFMTSVFLVCSIPLVLRIFVNQLYDPAYISAGGKPDYRGDILALRFASFNPILDPWVYILCRKNLLLKGWEKLKRAVTCIKDGCGDNIGWVGGQHSPPSLNSNDTSYTSLHTAYRNDVELQVTIKNTSFTDFARRQAWEYDTTRVNFHPFGVESTAILGKVDIVTCTFSTPSSCQSAKSL
ncbi:hypothetical protein VZT92_021269 [Zoarces viviparus]|uniref:G-protein coupled receptors family 1 profile domain-containing protein n=1 Tax=Zoarces viviparus TaxID=48416 RepID=A0AAW1EHN5_ZOAVI